MTSKLIKETSDQYQLHIKESGVNCALKHDITNKDGKVFLKANCPITQKIREKLNFLKDAGVINSQGIEDEITITDKKTPNEIIAQLNKIIHTNQTFKKIKINNTLETIIEFFQTQKIPEKLSDHLTIYSKVHPKEFNKTLTTLLFGTHIGNSSNYSQNQLNELIQVLLFENLGYVRLSKESNNYQTVHPIISHQISQLAGTENENILEGILEHEEKLNKTGFPNKPNQVHKYAQISQLSNQYIQLIKTNLRTTSQLGEIYLLTNSINFNSQKNNNQQISHTFQKPLIKIMQESLDSREKEIKYAVHLHQNLKELVNWCDKTKQNPTIAGIQKKIKSSLWVQNSKDNPFQISIQDIRFDKEIRKEFITDSMKYSLMIAQTASYLNKELNTPIRMFGASIQKSYFLELANPNNF